MTSVETDIPSIARLKTTRRFPEAQTLTPLTESTLMNITTANQLRPHLYALIDHRFSQEEATLGKNAYEIIVRQFEGQFRRNNSEAVVHPGGVAYWDLRTNPDISLVRFGIDLFHDNEEDLGLNSQDNYDLLSMADFPQIDAKLIALGSFAMSRIENGRKLPKSEYNKKIEIIHEFASTLDLPEIKPIDTWHNVMSDYTQLRTDPTNIDLARVYKYLHGKASQMLALAEKYAPLAQNTRSLRQAMILCEAELASVYTPPELQSPTAHVRV